jgi:hypothetical protein
MMPGLFLWRCDDCCSSENPQKGNPSKVLQVLKQKVSRSLRTKRSSAGRQAQFSFADEVDDACAFWQRRFYDFNVWSVKKCWRNSNTCMTTR